MSIGFVKIGYSKNGKNVPVKDFKTVKEHLKYIGFRSRDLVLEQEHFFSASRDHADWKDFYGGIENHRALQHSSTVKIHKVIFSLRDTDYEAYRNSGRDYKDIVRNVLKNYEYRKGVKLEWIAARHDQNHHPHCHVVIRAVTQDGPDGKSSRVYLLKEDIQKIKIDFENEVTRHRIIEREPVPEMGMSAKELFSERDLSDRDYSYKTPDSIASIFKQVQQSIDRKRRETAREGERERQRENRGRGR